MITPRAIDLATITTWPAAITEQHEGWYLLASGGVTGRVNAAWPLAWTGPDVDAAIDHVEAWYAARKLPPRFKLTDDAYAPTDLPTHLARRGYAPVMPTYIMTRTLAGGAHAHDSVTLTPSPSPLFEQALGESTPDVDDLEERRSIARRLPAPAAFAVREDAGRAVAIGASAIAGALAGIFLMRTVPEARRQGHALHVLRALINWAETNGAQHVFLQVEANNESAVALYRREGFAVLSTYRFWRKPPQ